MVRKTTIWRIYCDVNETTLSPGRARTSGGRAPVRIYWGRTKASLLPRQAQRELDLARGGRSSRSLAGDRLHRVADHAKRGGIPVSIRQSEVGPVENIEHLGSELKGFRFPQFEVANQREVPVGQTWPSQNISSRVSEGVRGRQGERGRICPLVDALMGGIKAHAGNNVRTIVVVNIVAGIAVDGGRVGRPGLHHGNPRHLPAVDEVVRLRVLQLSDLVPERQVVNVGEREALLVVEVRAALLRSEIIGILREARAGIGPEVGGGVVEGFRPGRSE